jgi:predicted ATP-grasp superfamily ATP-dependent carboligase
MVVRAGTRLAELPFSFPAVLKPIDGCGSQDIRRIERGDEVSWESIDRPLRLEEFVPGLAASVAVLCGPAGLYPLPACEQRLSEDGRFTYLGGRLPIEHDLEARARLLALAAVRALPEPQGYIGVDLVLGAAVDGSGDRVIEINPRLTTSYVGLRALSQSNLAATMLAVLGGVTPVLSFHQSQVEFTAEGTVTPTRSVSEGRLS